MPHIVLLYNMNSLMYICNKYDNIGKSIALTIIANGFFRDNCPTEKYRDNRHRNRRYLNTVPLTMSSFQESNYLNGL